jgi:hypothetical protein
MCPDQVLSSDQKARRFRTRNRRLLEVRRRRVLEGGEVVVRHQGEDRLAKRKDERHVAWTDEELGGSTG